MFEDDRQRNRSSSSADAGVQLRQWIGSAMVEATAWAEEHRRQLTFGSLAGIAGGIAVLLRIHGLPGVTRITSNVQLAARLVQQQETRHVVATVRLPVILAGLTVQDGRLLAQAVHYPSLCWWYDWCKGRKGSHMLPNIHTARTSSQIADAPHRCSDCSAHFQAQNHLHNSSSCSRNSGDNGADLLESSPHSRSSGSSSSRLLDYQIGTVTCYIAGMQDIHPLTLELLQQQLLRHPTRVHSLRVFALTSQPHNSSSSTSSHDSTSDPLYSSAADDSSSAGGSSRAQQPADTETLAPQRPEPASKFAPQAAPQDLQQHAHATADTLQAEPPAGYVAVQQQYTYSPTGSSPGSASTAENNSSSDTGREQGTLWAELWVLGGLPTRQLKATAKAIGKTTTNSSSGADGHPPTAATATAAATAVPGGSRWPNWLLFRRKDLTELLLLHGLARLAPHEDFEWLQLRPGAVRAYIRASDYAQVKRLGLYQQKQAAVLAGFFGKLRHWMQKMHGAQ